METINTTSTFVDNNFHFEHLNDGRVRICTIHYDDEVNSKDIGPCIVETRRPPTFPAGPDVVAWAMEKGLSFNGSPPVVAKYAAFGHDGTIFFEADAEHIAPAVKSRHYFSRNSARALTKRWAGPTFGELVETLETDCDVKPGDVFPEDIAFRVWQIAHASFNTGSRAEVNKTVLLSSVKKDGTVLPGKDILELTEETRPLFEQRIVNSEAVVFYDANIKPIGRAIPNIYAVRDAIFGRESTVTKAYFAMIEDARLYCGGKEARHASLYALYPPNTYAEQLAFFILRDFVCHTHQRFTELNAAKAEFDTAFTLFRLWLTVRVVSNTKGARLGPLIKKLRLPTERIQFPNPLVGFTRAESIEKYIRSRTVSNDADIVRLVNRMSLNEYVSSILAFYRAYQG